jgi:hypothetical protein
LPVAAAVLSVSTFEINLFLFQLLLLRRLRRCRFVLPLSMTANNDDFYETFERVEQREGEGGK